MFLFLVLFFGHMVVPCPNKPNQSISFFLIVYALVLCIGIIYTMDCTLTHGNISWKSERPNKHTALIFRLSIRQSRSQDVIIIRRNSLEVVLFQESLWDFIPYDFPSIIMIDHWFRVTRKFHRIFSRVCLS